MSLTRESATHVVIPPEFRSDADAFPPALRALLDDELAAGNTIAEASHGFPTLLDAGLAAGGPIAGAGRGSASPASAYFIMTGPVTTRLRESGGGLTFRDYGDCLHSGSFTDHRGHFFILEPPAASPDQTVMTAIQAPSPVRPPSVRIDSNAGHPDVNACDANARDANARDANACDANARDANARDASASNVNARDVNACDANARDANARDANARNAGDRATMVPRVAEPHAALGRFERSVAIDYEKPQDCPGYDLGALAAATPSERRAIEVILVERGIKHSRDVEALAALRMPLADAVLTAAIRHPDPEIRLAVMRYAWRLIPQTQRAASLVRTLKTASPYGGLCEALDEAADFHPKEVVEALFDGALYRDGESAIHFAALLMFVHGKASSPFDWNQRPFFLRFNTPHQDQREAVFVELCEKIGVDSSDHLRSRPVRLKDSGQSA